MDDTSCPKTRLWRFRGSVRGGGVDLEHLARWRIQESHTPNHRWMYPVRRDRRLVEDGELDDHIRDLGASDGDRGLGIKYPYLRPA